MLKLVLCLIHGCNLSQNFEGKEIGKRTFGRFSSVLDVMEPTTCKLDVEHTKLNRRLFDETSDCEDPTTEVEITTVPTTTVTTPKPVTPEGPFYNFILNICEVILTKFQSSRIPKYFKVLNRSLRGLGSGYLMRRLLNKFRRTLRTLSDFNGRILKLKVVDFLTILGKRKPKSDAFFHATNSIFNIWDDNKMDEYIYVLKKYGNGITNRIGERTRNVFKKLIFRTYYKQTDRIKADIQYKFKLAIVEYMESR
ncbi:uncharacterized protein LOC115446503 [Manduca sexta]|uniref:uncharacterized protein LOC115446503 n=1 Tax=Manduca sexta TaxID=7130 RepID=UPI00188DFD3A|nr:uncharacterized protein LOC115446503 [Manduca sexta]